MDRLSRSGPLLLVTGAVFILLGLALAIGGAWLLALGGSWYYLLAGLGVAASGVLLMLGRTWTLWLYALVLLGSTVWALVEVRLDGWQLLPRLDLWLVLALWLWLPSVNRRLGPVDAGQRAVPDRWLRGGRWVLGSIVLIALAVVATGLLRSPQDRAGEVAVERMAATGTAPAPFTPPHDWAAYGHSGYGDRYSPAAQITPRNVDRLKLAWTFRTGDFSSPGDRIEVANEVTPLKANGMLYLCTPHNIVIALDPDSGREIWRFDPRIHRDAKDHQPMVCRGVAYYDSGAYAAQAAAAGVPADSALAAAASAPTPPGAVAPTAIKVDTCPRRIFAPTADATIVAINADNGEPCRDFGDSGVIGLDRGQPTARPDHLEPASPPTVTRRVLIVGAGVTIHGYDIDSGLLLWTFDASAPPQAAPLPARQAYTRNSPHAAGVFSVDEQLGLVYLPMGNQTPDMRGGRRDPEGERYNSAIVALDIATGQVRWVYQTVHHDLWGMGIAGQPTLVDLPRPGGTVPALIASTRRGDIYVMDRRDGRLLVPAPERPVPQGAAAGDRVAPTQPFSALSYAPERTLREADMWGATPFDQLACRITFKRYRYEGIFTPPSEQGSIAYPGNSGVFDWGGIAVDPVRQVAVLDPNYMAFVAKLYPREKVKSMPGGGGEQDLQPMAGTPFALDLHPLLSPVGMPCQAPPWGYVAALDLRTMRKVWMHENGTTEDQAPFGLALPLGVTSQGGPIVTAGGVAFMSGTPDAYLRAYDLRTGNKLWQARLPAGGHATPMTYVSDRTGRQYVVVMAGGRRSEGTKMGGALAAYALPGHPATK